MDCGLTKQHVTPILSSTFMQIKELSYYEKCLCTLPGFLVEISSIC